MSHGSDRLGLLTSSKASVVMHGSAKAWAALRRELWSATAEDFDVKVTTGPRAWGHDHEANGAAKFWELHPEFEVEPGGFHTYNQPGPLCGWLASSPDRLLFGTRKLLVAGLEIKSPTTPELMASHTLKHHFDQCQHGMLTLGLPIWWLFVHHGKFHVEHQLTADPAWQTEYLRRAALLKDFVYEGRDVQRRKLSSTDLLD